MKFPHLKWWNPLHWCRWWYRRRFARIVQEAMSSKPEAVPLDDNDCAVVEAWVRDYMARKSG